MELLLYYRDSSFNERIEQFKYGLDAIKGSWFFGQYLGQTIVCQDSVYLSGFGSYMHNLLSFWRQYGVIFFIIFTIFYFSRLIKIYFLWKNTKENNSLNLYSLWVYI